VGAAIVNVKVTAWNGKRVIPVSRIEMNSNHSDAPRLDQVHMELELFHEPAALFVVKSNLKLQFGSRGKSKRFRCEFLQVISDRN